MWFPPFSLALYRASPLAYGSPTNFSLLQEDEFEILQEDGSLILLESAP